VAVDVLPQPAEERPELAAFHLGWDLRPVPDGRLEDLDGEDVACGVGREVAEEAEGPVGVLENARYVGLGREAQVLPGLRVPRVGQVGDGEATLEEGDLELEAQKNVEVVGELAARA
jgi:hypothetical protein